MIKKVRQVVSNPCEYKKVSRIAEEHRIFLNKSEQRDREFLVYINLLPENSPPREKCEIDEILNEVKLDLLETYLSKARTILGLDKSFSDQEVTDTINSICRFLTNYQNN